MTSKFDAQNAAEQSVISQLIDAEAVDDLEFTYAQRKAAEALYDRGIVGRSEIQGTHIGRYYIYELTPAAMTYHLAHAAAERQHKHTPLTNDDDGRIRDIEVARMMAQGENDRRRAAVLLEASYHPTRYNTVLLTRKSLQYAGCVFTETYYLHIAYHVDVEHQDLYIGWAKEQAQVCNYLRGMMDDPEQETAAAYMLYEDVYMQWKASGMGSLAYDRLMSINEMYG